MKYKSNRVEIGDIITSAEFVEAKTIEEKTLFSDEKFEVGWSYGCDNEDKTRAKAKYVIERAEMEGGGGAQAGDVYPDGWHITARRLDKNDLYNLNGEIIEFYQSGCFANKIEEVDVVGKMQRIFTKIN